MTRLPPPIPAAPTTTPYRSAHEPHPPLSPPCWDSGLSRGKGKGGKTVVHNAFQGRVRVTSRPLRVRPGASADDAEAMEVDEGGEQATKVVPFQLLSVELPPVPLFNDAEGGNVIPQVPHPQLQPLSSVLTHAPRAAPDSAV